MGGLEGNVLSAVVRSRSDRCELASMNLQDTALGSITKYGSSPPLFREEKTSASVQTTKPPSCSDVPRRDRAPAAWLATVAIGATFRGFDQ